MSTRHNMVNLLLPLSPCCNRRFCTNSADLAQRQVAQISKKKCLGNVSFRGILVRGSRDLGVFLQAKTRRRSRISCVFSLFSTLPQKQKTVPRCGTVFRFRGRRYSRLVFVLQKQVRDTTVLERLR